MSLSLGVSSAHADQVDLAAVARTWTVNYAVRGTKTEPTFVERVEYTRQGDHFSLRGDVDGQDLGLQALDLDPDGTIRVARCPEATVCGDAPPNGFLSTVAVLAALRAGRLTGFGDIISYAGRQAVCVPLEAIQPDLEAPVVLDPCLDLQTGALLAQRRRFDGLFGGAMLDEPTLRIDLDRPPQ